MVLGWIGIPVASFIWYGETLHFSMSDAVMGQRAVMAVAAMAVGATLPWTARPVIAALERRRQRELAREVERTLGWARKDRAANCSVRIAGLASMKLTVGHPRLPKALRFDTNDDGRDERIGDPKLDDRIRVEADQSGLVLAALGPQARAELAELLDDCDRLEVRDETLIVHTSARRAPEELVDLGTSMLGFLEQLKFPPSKVPARLEQRFREDALPGAREAALKALLTHHPESVPGRALAKEILQGDDTRLGLLVAQTLGDEAMIQKFEARVEGSRGRLAVSADPEAGGGLSLDRRAQAGALSAPKKK